jgi:tetratricopeptide (TPR) repeat protein
MLDLQRGDYPGALKLLAQLPADYGASYAVTLARCTAEAGAGHSAAALRWVDQLEKSAELTEPQALTVAAAGMKAAPKVAVRLLEILDRRGAATATGLQWLGLAYETQHRFPAARQAYERAAAAGGATAPLLVDLGRVADAAGEKEAALGYLAHARELEPGDAKIHYAFGRICVDLDLAVEALHAFEQSAKLAPDSAEYHYALGLALLTNNRPADAAAEFERYLVLKPNDAWGHYSLARADFDRLEDERARSAFTLAESFPETAAGAHFYLGRLAARALRFDQAVTEFEASLRIHPGSAEVLTELGATRMELGEYTEGIAALEQAVARAPKSFHANLALLRLYNRTADPRVARQSELVKQLDQERVERAQRVQRTLRFEQP